jgi:hypothetical protein
MKQKHKNTIANLLYKVADSLLYIGDLIEEVAGGLSGKHRCDIAFCINTRPNAIHKVHKNCQKYITIGLGYAIHFEVERVCKGCLDEMPKHMGCKLGNDGLVHVLPQQKRELF